MNACISFWQLPLILKAVGRRINKSSLLMVGISALLSANAFAETDNVLDHRKYNCSGEMACYAMDGAYRCYCDGVLIQPSSGAAGRLRTEASGLTARPSRPKAGTGVVRPSRRSGQGSSSQEVCSVTYDDGGFTKLYLKKNSGADRFEVTLVDKTPGSSAKVQKFGDMRCVSQVTDQDRVYSCSGADRNLSSILQIKPDSSGSVFSISQLSKRKGKGGPKSEELGQDLQCQNLDDLISEGEAPELLQATETDAGIIEVPGEEGAGGDPLDAGDVQELRDVVRLVEPGQRSARTARNGRKARDHSQEVPYNEDDPNLVDEGGGAEADSVVSDFPSLDRRVVPKLDRNGDIDFTGMERPTVVNDPEVEGQEDGEEDGEEDGAQ